jgi:chaperone required for assembly of F1-ATPase
VKRFYREARVEDGRILLDGREVKTPARRTLRLPGAALAEAVAAEWAAQGERIDPRAMPLTGLANAAIDRVEPERDAFVAGLARYAESDLLCYRASEPDSLVARQAAAWDPLLGWARRRYDVDFETVAGVMHRPQPTNSCAQLAQAVAARDAFALAGLSPLVTLSGSLVIGLAVAEGAVEAEEAWSAASVDEQWQAEKWGEDAEAAAALEARRRDFLAAARFLDLLGAD